MFEKLQKIYPSLTIADISPRGTIVIQNDHDGKGDYIRSWNHPTLAEPTQEQLDGVK